MTAFSTEEIRKTQAYLRKTFACEDISLRSRPKATDSLEALIDGEFIGTVYRDEDDGEVSYTFTMSILDIDLPE